MDYQLIWIILGIAALLLAVFGGAALLHGASSKSRDEQALDDQEQEDTITHWQDKQNK